MELDEPLAAVVGDSWDREAFKQQLEEEQAFEKGVQAFAQLAGQGKFDEAGKMLDEQIANTKNPEIKEQWLMVRHRFRLLTGQGSKEDFDYYRSDMKKYTGNAAMVYRMAMMLYGITQIGGDIGPLTDEAIAALNKEVEGEEADQNKVAIFEAIARLHTVNEDFEKAVAVQEKAVGIADGLSRSMKSRASLFLDELKSKVEKTDEKPEETESDQ